MSDSSSVYDLVGESFFIALVDEFYRRVETDAVLRPLYPPDLRSSRQALTEFLVQYWGGPAAYSATRGHPRLRQRHVHIRIGAAERDAWYEAMAAALETLAPRADIRSAMLEYFARSADWMVNAEEPES